MSENKPEHHYITLPLMLHLSFEKAVLPAIVVPPGSPLPKVQIFYYIKISCNHPVQSSFIAVYIAAVSC